MPGIEILIQATDKASPEIQQLSQMMTEAAQNSDKFAKEVVDAATRAHEHLGKIPPKAKETADSVKTMGQAADQLKQQLLGFATVAGITAFFKSSADAALQSEEAMRRLAFAVNSTGGSFDREKERITAFAREQQSLTRFSDTQTYESMGRLVRVTGDVGQAMQATKLAFGMASASGKDINTVLDMLAPVLQGDASRMRMLKNEFGAFVGDADTAQGVIDNLSKHFVGAAEKEAGFAGELSKTRNTLSNFQETVGGGVLPVFRGFLAVVEQGARFFEILGVVIANMAAKALVSFQAMGQEFKAIFTGHFNQLPEIAKQTAAKMNAIEEESASQAAAVHQRYSKQKIETANEEGRIMARIGEDQVRKAEESEMKKVDAARNAYEAMVRLDAERLRLEGDNYESRVRLIELEKEERLRQFDEMYRAGVITEHELQKAKTDTAQVAKLKSLEAKQEQLKDLSELQKEFKKFGDSIASSVGKAVADIILEGKTFEQAYKDIMQSVLRMAIETFTRIVVEAAIARAASQGVMSGAGSAIPAIGAIGIFAAVGSSMFKKYQHGGIVTEPTLGLVGEAGPEAIIPLNRSGGIGREVALTIQQTNNFNLTGASDDQAREIMRRISEITRSGAAEGAEMVKSILAQQNRFAGEAV